jgi:hypothetical protein
MSRLPAYTWDGEKAVIALRDFLLLCMREGQFTWKAAGEEEFKHHLGEFLQPTDSYGPVLPNESVQADGLFRFAAMDDWTTWESAPPFAFEVKAGHVHIPRPDLQRLAVFLDDRAWPWNHSLVSARVV